MNIGHSRLYSELQNKREQGTFKSINNFATIALFALIIIYSISR